MENNNSNLDGNIRDYTDILYLVVLSNLEVLNASMIDNNIPQEIRIEKLNQTARKELAILLNDKNVVDIEKLDKKSNKMIENKRFKCDINKLHLLILHKKYVKIYLINRGVIYVRRFKKKYN